MPRAALGLLLLVCACSSYPAASVPMRTVFHPAPSGNATTLVVLLPGRGDKPEHFARHGFVERRREGQFVRYRLAGEDVYKLCDIMCGAVASEKIDPPRKQRV